MRRSIAKILSAAFLISSVTGLAATAANANLYAHEDHCFPNGPTTDVRDAQDDYADGTLRDQATVKAVEDLNARLWKLRLDGLPIQAARKDLLQAREDARDHFHNHNDNSAGHHHHYYYPYYWSSIYQAERYVEARERDSRRTGSKYLYVTPAQKQLSRERSMIRSFQQKPCNPNIIYLGTN